jgi:hypothetical protein
VQRTILVDGVESMAMRADLEACLGEAGGDGWVVSAVQLGPVWWCLNVLAAPGDRLPDWSLVGRREEVLAGFKDALHRASRRFDPAC